MTLLADRPVASTEIQPELLFREARERRHRRWVLGVGIAILMAAVITTVVVRTSGRKSMSNPAHLKPPPGVPAYSSKSSPVAPALKGPEALAVASDGGVLIDEQASNQIVEREPSGRFKLIAGNGRIGFSGDGGPAIRAELDTPVGMAVASNGTVYVADLGNNRVRSIAPDGVISTAAHVSQPEAVAIGPNGSVYVLDQSGVQFVNRQGNLVRIIAPTTIPANTPGFPYGADSVLSVDGTSFAFVPNALAVSSSGDIYVANFSPKVVIRFPPSGPPSLVGQSSVEAGDIYVTPGALVSAPDGSVLVGDYGIFAVDRISGSSLSPAATFGLNAVAGLHGGFRPSGVAVAANGEIYAATDGENGGTNVPALVSIDSNGDVHLLDEGDPVPPPKAGR
jgi:NHL repeat